MLITSVNNEKIKEIVKLKDKKYRDKRLDPKIYFLVTFVLFLLIIKDVIFICFNEIYGIIY